MDNGQKRVIIVHCWEESPQYCWYPYAKRELEARGYAVSVPQFPNPNHPTESMWVPYLSAQIGAPDHNVYLIGHSVGAITILRYLETLTEGQRIGGVITVAGFTDSMGYGVFENFFTTPLPFALLRHRARRFVAIRSDNDPYIEPKYGDILRDKLGAQLIVVPGAKHFSGPLDAEDSCTSFPEVVGAILQASA
ncbi:MAG TPA: alpha/beta hydrolase [Candidatus Paceibacterota bacterium]